MIREQLRDELYLLRSSWALYRTEAGALARALLIALVAMTAASTLVTPFIVRDDALSRPREGIASVLVAALVLSPLTGGLFAIALGRLCEGRPGRARDIFVGYRRFLPLAAAGALAGCTLELRDAGFWHTGLALRLIAVVIGFAASLLLFYLVPTIVDRRLSLWASLAAALRLLRPPELWRTLTAAVLLFAVWLLLEQPAKLLGRGGPELEVLYLAVVLLAWGPFSVAYIAQMYVRARDAQAGVADV